MPDKYFRGSYTISALKTFLLDPKAIHCKTSEQHSLDIVKIQATQSSTLLVQNISKPIFPTLGVDLWDVENF